MFSRFSKPVNPMPSFIVSDKDGNPKAIFVSNEHAQDPEMMELLRDRQKRGKLHVADKNFDNVLR